MRVHENALNDAKNDTQKLGISDVKTTFRCTPALIRWLSENSSCKQFQVQKYEEQHELNTLADLNTKESKFTTAEDRNRLCTKTRLRLVREKGNAPTREQKRLFASNIKGLKQGRIGAPSCRWTGEGGGTLQRLCSP